MTTGVENEGLGKAARGNFEGAKGKGDGVDDKAIGMQRDGLLDGGGKPMRAHRDNVGGCHGCCGRAHKGRKEGRRGKSGRMDGRYKRWREKGKATKGGRRED